MDCNFWDKITDIINNPEELLDLLSVEMCVEQKPASSGFQPIYTYPFNTKSEIIVENSFSRYHPKTRHSGPSKRVNVVRKYRHVIKSVLEDKNRTFLMHRILRLKASAEHTQFRKFGGERIIINLNNYFDS